MPIVEEHVRFCVREFGEENRELCYMVNSWMDAPSADFGASHRRQRHHYWFTPLQACSIYEDYNSQLVVSIVLQHLKLDGLITPEEERNWDPEEAETKLEKAIKKRDDEEREGTIKEEQRKLEHEKWLEVERKRIETEKIEGRSTTIFSLAGFALGASIALLSLKVDNMAFSLLLFLLGGCAGAFVTIGFNILTSPIKNLKLRGTVEGIIGGVILGYVYAETFSKIPVMIIFGFLGGVVGFIIGYICLQARFEPPIHIEKKSTQEAKYHEDRRIHIKSIATFSLT